jgi:tetratricopeptide (TPR) repeat protein
MRNWLAVMAAAILYVAEPGRVAGAPIDCGPAPKVACLSAAIFSLAKMLPDDDYFRPHVSFAERELAPGDIKTALQYIVTDNPDPPPWDDIDWIAQAGRFDRAISRAKQRSSPTERLGGLLAVAERMLDKHDTRRATRIVDDVERELPSIARDRDECAGLLPNIAAEILARLGQTERAARLLGKSGVDSVETTLSIARRYPAAASLRELAWREAERANEPRVWQRLLEDAKSRSDKADVSRVEQHAGRSIDVEIRDDLFYVDPAIFLARALLEAGLPDIPARLAKQWTRWVEGKDARTRSDIVNVVIPLLVDLALDQDVQLAANSVSNIADRSQCLSKAAEEYFRIGRNDVARKFDAEALRVAVSSPTGEPELQQRHDAALHNLALARADHGDIRGALEVATRLGDENRIREVTSYIVRRAIDSGHGPGAGPAIQAVEQQASAAQDVSLQLQAANYWYEVGEVENARRSLAQFLKMWDEIQSSSPANDAGVASELMWRIDGNGKAQALLEIVDKFEVNDPSAIDRLVEIIRPVSPAVAVELTGR